MIYPRREGDMNITEDIEYLCIHIRSEKEWNRTIKKLNNAGWFVTKGAIYFEYDCRSPILYIGLRDKSANRLFYSNVPHSKGYPKYYLKISITELNIMIKTGQLLLLLL